MKIIDLFRLRWAAWRIFRIELALWTARSRNDKAKVSQLNKLYRIEDDRCFELQEELAHKYRARDVDHLLSILRSSKLYRGYSLLTRVAAMEHLS